MDITSSTPLPEYGGLTWEQVPSHIKNRVATPIGAQLGRGMREYGDKYGIPPIGVGGGYGGIGQTHFGYSSQVQAAKQKEFLDNYYADWESYQSQRRFPGQRYLPQKWVGGEGTGMGALGGIVEDTTLSVADPAPIEPVQTIA
jgi:hypothetical protein